MKANFKIFRKKFSFLWPDIGQLEAVAFAAIDVEHGKGGEGGTKGGEAEDEHRRGVGRVCLVGTTYQHGDDGSAEILDEENHGVGCAQTFQGNDFGHTRPQGCWCQRIADAENHHQRDGYGAAVHGQREAEMDGGQHECSRDDQGDAASVAVVDESEEWRHEHGAKGGYAGEESCYIGVYGILHHHQFGGEFQEG